GFVIKPGDISTLANNIIYLLNNKSHIEKIGENNAEKIRTKYNVYNSLDKMCGLYEDIVKKKYK
ncbi:glycosyltransferase family 1 protein, partial [Bacillus thuringiensis]|nr:glycosyltransferase family 1 protein [Bacillus thuringiensis]